MQNLKNNIRLGRSAQLVSSVACAFFTLSDYVHAQTKPFDNPTDIVSQEDAESFGLRTGSFVVAPVPFESPSFGTGLALGGAYLFKEDRLSDTSSLGFGAFKTSNDSQGFGLGLNLSWNEGRWRAKFILADADLNYNLLVGGITLPVNQSLRGASFELAYSPAANYSFGGSLGYGETSLKRQAGGILPPIFDQDSSLEIARLTAFAEYDTRDDTFYPTDGALLNGTVIQGFFLGSDRSSYTKAVVSTSGYLPVLSQSVIAGQLVVCAASDDAPFFDSCSLGATDNLRGYVSTEFLDKALFSFQAEFRSRITKRLGYTVFAGAGSVGGDLSSAFSENFKAAGGLGLRIRLSKKFPLDYAVDLSVDESGDQLLYVGVGQNF